MRLDSDIHVKAGLLRHRITINQQGPTSPPTTDSAGPVLVWNPVLVNAPAQIIGMRATDALRSGQDITQVYTIITIRYISGILPNMQVVTTTGATYVIQAVNNVDERNIILEITCVLLGNQI
jgi:head-tail adaptor